MKNYAKTCIFFYYVDLKSKTITKLNLRVVLKRLDQAVFKNGQNCNMEAI